MKIELINSNKSQILISGTNINLKDTFNCGQCFRWNEDKNGFVGISDGKIIRAIQEQNGFILENTNLEDVNSYWVNYFDLKTNYKSIAKNLPDDDYLQNAAAFGKGIHILKQNPLEILISFIISANNNISRIKKIIEKFCSMYGKEIKFEGKTYYTFPEKEDLKNVSLFDLQLLHAGYRDSYIMDAVEKINNGLDFKKLNKLNSEDLRKSLLEIKGVGPKVCDCIMLFGFSRYECFPKDVWIKRVITDIYGENFDEKAFGKYAGVVQQYLFHYARNNREEK